MDYVVTQRIMALMEYLEMSQNVFAQSIGHNQSNISKILRGERPATVGLVNKIVIAYPQVNRDWLLYGTGEMLLPEGVAVETRPHLPVEAVAGAIGGIATAVTKGDCKQLPVIPNVPNYDLTIPAYGDSMYPRIHSGDILAIRKVSDIGYIRWGDVHVVSSADGVAVKILRDAGDAIRCESVNADYDPYLIPKTDIYDIYRVVGLVRQF